MPRRVLWLPEQSFRKELAQTLEKIGVIDPEPVDEIHVSVSGAWANDFEVRGILDPQPSGLVGPLITVMKYQQEAWKKVALAVICEPLIQLHDRLVTESGKVRVESFSPHITLSRTLQGLSSRQVSELWKFVGQSFRFTDEVRQTPGREKMLLRKRLQVAGALLPPPAAQDYQSAAD